MDIVRNVDSDGFRVESGHEPIKRTANADRTGQEMDREAERLVAARRPIIGRSHALPLERFPQPRW